MKKKTLPLKVIWGIGGNIKFFFSYFNYCKIIYHLSTGNLNFKTKTTFSNIIYFYF